MKIILSEDVNGLGKIGDIVTVSDGHARNFLFPKKLAKLATEQNLKEVETKRVKQKGLEEQQKKIALELKEKLVNVSCTILVQAGDDEKLFGSVTADMIAKAFEAEGVAIDKKNIKLDEPIKKLGVYNVEAKLHPEVEATLKVWVVKK